MLGAVAEEESLCLPRSMNCRVCQAAMFAMGPSLEFPWTSAFFQGQCSRCDSSRFRRRLSTGTLSFLLISLRREAEESHRPRRWKQWLHMAREMRDSLTPLQPKRAKPKATTSTCELGTGVSGTDVKNVEGMRWTMRRIDGSG